MLHDMASSAIPAVRRLTQLILATTCLLLLAGSSPVSADASDMLGNDGGVSAEFSVTLPALISQAAPRPKEPVQAMICLPAYGCFQEPTTCADFYGTGTRIDYTNPRIYVSTGENSFRAGYSVHCN